MGNIMPNDSIEQNDWSELPDDYKLRYNGKKCVAEKW
jgi:hypothetical protein